MRKATKASVLSFILPGAGLWYCNYRKLAIANLLLAIAVPVIGSLTEFLSEHIQWLILAIAAGSAGLAHAMARTPE